MRLNCIIIDDEPIARKVLEEFIEDIGNFNLIASVENPVKALPFLTENRIDLLFLDINMPKMNGFQFIKSSQNLPPVIITTAYSEFAVEGFELDVLDYLVKPVSFERFMLACSRAMNIINQDGKTNSISERLDYFFIKNNGVLEKIHYKDLIYAEGFLNYVMLYTVSGKLMVYLTIKSLVDQLPPDQFLKVHKSYIININKIKSIDGNQVDMGIKKITISQSLRDEVIKKIVKDSLIKR